MLKKKRKSLRYAGLIKTLYIKRNRFSDISVPRDYVPKKKFGGSLYDVLSISTPIGCLWT